MKSQLKEIGPVTFPEHTGEKVYMLPFKQSEGLPQRLARWQPTVDAMLAGIQTDKPIYLMIDQGEVKAGQTHRRGGAHIDGNWIEANGKHGTRPPSHTKFASWDTGGWGTENLKPEALLLASNVEACCAYVGEVAGAPNEGGDCSHLDLATAERVSLKAGRAYIGNVTMIHESLPVKTDCKRTVVRLNAPGVEF